MPFDNFENRHFTAEETATLLDTLTALEAAMSGKMANLSPRERLQYGSAKNQNKLFINKVKEYNDTQPQLSASEVDWEEFNHDYNSRRLLEGVIQRLDALRTGANNAKILHDRDNYKAALTDYNYTKYKRSTVAAGYATKANELSQFFLNRGKRKEKSAGSAGESGENRSRLKKIRKAGGEE